MDKAIVALIFVASLLVIGLIVGLSYTTESSTFGQVKLIVTEKTVQNIGTDSGKVSLEVIPSGGNNNG